MPATLDRDRTQREPALEATGLRKQFGPGSGVGQVGLALTPGRIHALLGPNGSGKTTVLRMLLGLIQPDAGAIERAGRPVGGSAPRGRLSVAGYVDTPRLTPYLSVRRNLDILCAFDGCPPAPAGDRIESVLAAVGLAGRAEARVRSLSAGQRQRLGIAAVLLAEPAVLILDEPMTALDPAGQLAVRALLTARARRGGAVLLSTHDLVDVEQLCDDVTVLRQGRVAYSGSLADLQRRAPHSRWLLTTTDDQAALTTLSTRAGVRAEAGEAALTVTADPATLDILIRALLDAGIGIRALRREGTNFENLYLELTDPPAGNEFPAAS